MPRNKSQDQIARDLEQTAWNLLVQSCPLLFRGRDSYGFECNSGWFDIIATLCHDIEKLIAEMPEIERFHEPQWGGEFMYGIAQVKEKYGTLRFYMHSEPDGAQDLIEAAEIASSKTCEFCGKPGEIRRLSWIRTLCDEDYEAIRPPPKE